MKLFKNKKEYKVIFLNLLILIEISLLPLKKTLKLKIALCTMAKKENLYIKEFVDYYIKLGFDHIYIYDNNPPNTEKISDIINESYNTYVTIYESISLNLTNQSLAFTNCYHNIKKDFDWIFMIDVDEYLVIKNETLKNYLSDNIFKECDFLKIHWLQPTNNNLVHYDNRPLLERFKGPYLKDTHIKTMVRGNIDELRYDIHSPSYAPIRNATCNNKGEKLQYNNDRDYLNDVKEINYDRAYILHFKYKSTEEYINKYKRGYGRWFGSEFLPLRIREYFTDNKVTLEKIEYMEKELNLNLSEYKKLIPLN